MAVSGKGLRFCANLNFLFTENGIDFVQQYRLAKKAGFQGVEGGIPNGLTVEEAVAVQQETGIQQVLLNIITSPENGGQFGCAANAGSEAVFKTNFTKTLEFAKALNCKKIHIMAGKYEINSANKVAYLKNLKWASKLLEAERIVGVIEPICEFGVPGYFLNNFRLAKEVIEAVQSPYIRLMVDLFHLQHIQGNITKSLEELKDIIGHIQIAQVPGRNEPNSFGELNYTYIFDAIQKDANYNGWVGCEYKPFNGTLSGLSWPNDYGFQL